MVTTVFQDVQEFASGAPQSDDITVVAICYRGREGSDIGIEQAGDKISAPHASSELMTQ